LLVGNVAVLNKRILETVLLERVLVLKDFLLCVRVATCVYQTRIVFLGMLYAISVVEVCLKICSLVDTS
jgi:hypothetical protein